MALDLIGYTETTSDFGLNDSQTTFPVEAMQIQGRKEDDDGEYMYGSLPAPKHKAVVRTDTDEIVGIVGSNYRVLPNAEFFGMVEETIRETIDESLLAGAHVRERTTGSWSMREYVLPEFAVRLRGSQHETDVGLRIIASNSYDGGSSASILSGLIDFYCTNGMVVGRDVASVLARHSSGLTTQRLRNPLIQSLTTAQEHVDELQTMITTPMDEDAPVSILEKFFSGKRAAEIFEQLQNERVVRGDNVFALHSALTHYASHDSYNTRGDEPTSPRNMFAREHEVGRVLRSPEFRSLYTEDA